MKKCMHHETPYGLSAGFQTRVSLRGGYGHTFPGTGPGSGAKCSDFLLIPDHFRSPNLSYNSRHGLPLHSRRLLRWLASLPPGLASFAQHEYLADYTITDSKKNMLASSLGLSGSIKPHQVHSKGPDPPRLTVDPAVLIVVVPLKT